MGVVATQACTAFVGTQHLAAGSVCDVARAVKIHVDAHPESQVLMFGNTTVWPVEFDLRGTAEDVLARLDRAAPSAVQPAEPESRPCGPGRPKLGVIAREVILLPHHWDWLAVQPGGASVMLRKPVKDARRAAEDTNHRREVQEAAHRFMSAMAGNAVRLGDVTCALFVVDAMAFESFTQSWLADVCDLVCELASRAFRPQQEAAWQRLLLARCGEHPLHFSVR